MYYTKPGWEGKRGVVHQHNQSAICLFKRLEPTKTINPSNYFIKSSSSQSRSSVDPVDLRTFVTEHLRMMKSTWIVALLVAMLWARAESQSCTNVIITLSPCLNYITGNSSTPSSGCCSQLASVVGSQPQCLCQVLNGGGSSIGLNINQTQALALPSACNVQTPSISSCNVASPANSPADSPEALITEPSDNGSKSVPSTPQGTSNGNSLHLSKSLLFLILSVTTLVSAVMEH